MIFVKDASDADISIINIGRKVYHIRGRVAGTPINCTLMGAGVVRGYLKALEQMAGAFIVFDMSERINK